MDNETQHARHTDGRQRWTLPAITALSNGTRFSALPIPEYRGNSSCRRSQANCDWTNSRRSLSAKTIRQLVLQRLGVLKLHAPFSWEAYVLAIQRELADCNPGHRLLIERADLGSWEFGRWVVTHLPAVHRSLAQDRTSGDASEKSFAPNDVEHEDLVVEWLQLPRHLDDEHLEHTVFHELGHRELGHITPEAKPASRPGVFACEKDSLDTRERDAEMFATIVTRLAHGWDPGVVHAPCLDRFFDLLS